ncbi:hypothetical protein DFA_06438 [Cavenderia fasciculata]|uniref:DUF4203 domain-containing protein n=1 Tax=Cavenderia fasciculata TaxID=261658 RepID=F4PJ02_CACFS|nr:uncharacterized protein DFA_06438 [Cavenderia fasciculata]EGG24288.1 hypothetical protein DFA_06438 [Cavenderia fasciculata]|eukprot:XP_004362139.1 hypothetical protein DFA_06438 [Cavenderia fasciculata]
MILEMNQLIGFGLLFGGWITIVFGYKFKDIFLSFFGSALGAVLVYQVATHYNFAFALHIGLSFVVSVICSLICIRYKKISSCLIGIISCVYVSHLVVFYVSSESSWYNYVVLAINLFIPFFCVVYPLFSLLLSFATYGSWAFVIGLDQFMGVGYPTPVSMWCPGSEWLQTIKCSQSALLMFLLFVSISTLSTFIQYYLVNQLHEKHSSVLLSDDIEHPSDQEEDDSDLASSSCEEDNLLNSHLRNDDGSLYKEDDGESYHTGAMKIDIKDGDAPYCDPSAFVKAALIDKSYLKGKDIKKSESEPLMGP